MDCHVATLLAMTGGVCIATSLSFVSEGEKSQLYGKRQITIQKHLFKNNPEAFCV
jgi:hypothetical protein